ncbi:DoxX family protein [Sphingobacterium suaedae]|uniref:DoxX family membrane protein n=1 Tax=Sphingobacterium suaedae TaxID=1686402 RepID=A0ABW5KJX0_9SPHI
MEKPIDYETGTIQHLCRVILGFFMLFSGIGHLTFGRIHFRAQVPAWILLNVDTVVILSGIVEILLAILVLFFGHRKRWIPWLLAVFFLVVFPGNWAQYVHKRDAFGLNTDAARLIRLFFQPVLMIWALWSMGIIGRYKKQRNVLDDTDAFPHKLR